jgi:hypothetical protein
MSKKEATPGVWEKFCELTQKIIEASQVKICDGMGEGVPDIDKDGIFINGDASEGLDFETLGIERKATNESGFCKTGRRPYDVVVCAVLSVGAKLKILTWSSDGKDKDGDFDECKKLLDSLK